MRRVSCLLVIPFFSVQFSFNCYGTRFEEIERGFGEQIYTTLWLLFSVTIYKLFLLLLIERYGLVLSSFCGSVAHDANVYHNDDDDGDDWVCLSVLLFLFGCKNTKTIHFVATSKHALLSLNVGLVAKFWHSNETRLAAIVSFFVGGVVKFWFREFANWRVPGFCLFLPIVSILFSSLFLYINSVTNVFVCFFGA